MLGLLAVRTNKWLGPSLHDEGFNLKVLLYGHLSAAEREIKTKPRAHHAHTNPTEQYGRHGRLLAMKGIDDWAGRLLNVMQDARRSKSVSIERPLEPTNIAMKKPNGATTPRI
jgi:hypothetical protein